MLKQWVLVLIGVLFLLVPDAGVAQQTYLSAEDALNQVAHGQTVPGQRAGYVSAETALNQALEIVQTRNASNTTPHNSTVSSPSDLPRTQEDGYPTADYARPSWESNPPITGYSWTYAGTPGYNGMEYPGMGYGRIGYPGTVNSLPGYGYPTAPYPPLYAQAAYAPANVQAFNDWLFGRSTATRSLSQEEAEPASIEVAAVVLPLPDAKPSHSTADPATGTPTPQTGAAATTSHIRIETHAGATDAILNEDRAQLATLERLQSQQFAFEQQRLEQEAAIRRIQRLIWTGVMASIPLVFVFFVVTKKLFSEYGKIQRERYEYELERLRQENEQLKAAETLLQKT